MGSTMDEYVDEEEFLNKDMDTKKTTFRVKTKAKERRYSRIQMGREKSVAKSQGLNIKWGINLEWDQKVKSDKWNSALKDVY